jgi:hypothetical protein
VSSVPIPGSTAPGEASRRAVEFYRLGIDGVFADFPDTAVVARLLFDLERNPDAGRCLTGVVDGPRRHQPDCD